MHQLLALRHAVVLLQEHLTHWHLPHPSTRQLLLLLLRVMPVTPTAAPLHQQQRRQY
jgi:hypothetical protein